MTARERFLASLRGEATDRPAVGTPTSVVTMDVMSEVGAYFPEAHTDAETMARLAATGHTVLGFDTIAPCFSVQQEAAAFGCSVSWGDAGHMPSVRGHLFDTADDIRLPADYLDRLPTRTVCDALRLLKERHGEDVALIGKVMGPWTLAYHLFGIESFLMRVLDDPGEVVEILDRLSDAVVMFAQAQIEAGADCLTLGDHLTGDLCRAETYRDLLLPVHQRLATQIEAPIILHICGYTLDRMEHIAQSGFAAYHFESKNDPYEAMEVVGGRIALLGNVNNPDTLYLGKLAQVDEEVRRALDAGVQVIAPECAVPLNMSSIGLKRIVAAARGA